MTKRCLPAVALLLASAFLPLTAATAPAAQAAAGPADPWAPFQQVRQRLVEDGATVADFSQTYRPAGFSSGETEIGRVAFDLPTCLRWDYVDPYPKSFLVCGDEAFSWLPEDGTGRRLTVDSRNEPGLDLLLLEPSQLARRYEARLESAPEGGLLLLHLTPREPLPEVSRATLTLSPEEGRLTGLEYQDGEGNLTRFELTGYRPLAEEGRFGPPSEIEWEEGR